MITIKSFEVNYFSENTYLLYDDTKEAVLIDCGCLRKEEQKEVSDFIAQNGLTLKRYLCTHLHLDHIFGNEFIHDTYGLSPEAHKADVEGLPSPEEQAKAFGLPDEGEKHPGREISGKRGNHKVREIRAGGIERSRQFARRLGFL